MRDNKKNEKQLLNIESNNNNTKTVDKSKTTINKNKTVDKSKNNKIKTVDKSRTVDKSKNVDKSRTIMNKNKTVNKSKAVDKSKNKNIINKMYYIYKQNIDNNKKKIQRPGLFNRENDSIIKFTAIIVGEYARFSNCITIINLHRGKEYLADHTQLFLNESLEEFIKRNTTNSCLIHATGKIKEYSRKND